METRDEWIQWGKQNKQEAEAFICKLSNLKDPADEEMIAQLNKVIAALDNLLSIFHSFDDEEFERAIHALRNMKTEYNEI